MSIPLEKHKLDIDLPFPQEAFLAAFSCFLSSNTSVNIDYSKFHTSYMNYLYKIFTAKS